MRHIGFSTGALAKGDVYDGVALQTSVADISAIELSALRESELRRLVTVHRDLDLTHFQYISVHAPSRFSELPEPEAVELLLELPAEWPIIVHPDSIQDFPLWRALGDRLCLENMDIRKRTGRTAEELASIFQQLPDARFCLDLGHAHQVDSTMSVAADLLRRFGDRLRQLHVSDVGTFGQHRPIGYLLEQAYQRVKSLIATDVPAILESIVAPGQIGNELAVAKRMLAPSEPAFGMPQSG